MNIYEVTKGPLQTNSYLVVCKDSGQSAIIDPARGSSEVFSEILEKKNLQLKEILLTHSHWDHIADVVPLKKRWNCNVVIHSLDAYNLQNPGIDGLPCWIAIDGIKEDRRLEDRDKIQIGNLYFITLHTPGHSPGGVCFYEEEKKVLFSGDTLFKKSYGNLSFPTAEPEKMKTSLLKLSKLPPETRVYPGHGEKTTIGEENWIKKTSA